MTAQITVNKWLQKWLEVIARGPDRRKLLTAEWYAQSNTFHELVFGWYLLQLRKENVLNKPKFEPLKSVKIFQTLPKRIADFTMAEGKKIGELVRAAGQKIIAKWDTDKIRYDLLNGNKKYEKPYLGLPPSTQNLDAKHSHMTDETDTEEEEENSDAADEENAEREATYKRLADLRREKEAEQAQEAKRLQERKEKKEAKKPPERKSPIKNVASPQNLRDRYYRKAFKSLYQRIEDDLELTAAQKRKELDLWNPWRVRMENREKRLTFLTNIARTLQTLWTKQFYKCEERLKARVLGDWNEFLTIGINEKLDSRDQQGQINHLLFDLWQRIGYRLIHLGKVPRIGGGKGKGASAPASKKPAAKKTKIIPITSVASAKDLATAPEFLAQLDANLDQALFDTDRGIASIWESDRYDIRKRLLDTIATLSVFAIPFEAPLNFRIVGEPGAGKTTIASAIAFCYSKMGILPRDSVSEIPLSTLVSPNVSETPIKTAMAFFKVLGGCGIIDEAHNLASQCAGDLRDETEAAGVDAEEEIIEENKREADDEVKDSLKPPRRQLYGGVSEYMDNAGLSFLPQQRRERVHILRRGGAIPGSAGISHGPDAVRQLNELLSQFEGLIVLLLAGYEKNIQCLFNVEQGLGRRVPNIIRLEFPPYKDLTRAAAQRIQQIFDALNTYPEFGQIILTKNAREYLFEKIKEAGRKRFKNHYADARLFTVAFGQVLAQKVLLAREGQAIDLREESVQKKLIDDALNVFINNQK